MMNDFENVEKKENEIFSKVLRAGKRTYFFDVRETKAGDYYLTITESKKKILKISKTSLKKLPLSLLKKPEKKLFPKDIETIFIFNPKKIKTMQIQQIFQIILTLNSMTFR